MTEAEVNLERLDHLLDQLISNAELLVKVSSQKNFEEELSPLQKRQDELIAQLNECERGLKNLPQNVQLHGMIQEKLHVFVKLNKQFVDNIVSSHGLINFNTKSDE